MTEQMSRRFQTVNLVVCDVDGVLTDGRINLDDQGREIKSFDVQDGFGLVLLRRAGLKTAIITARESAAVKIRGKDLGIDVVKTHAFPKMSAYKEVLETLEQNDEQVCFVGDDLTDLAVMRRVGLAVAVPNAREEIKQIAHHVTSAPGGRGAVREVVEMILKAQDKWQSIVEELS
jgi:3-deoxy-D-manno-octulosonate 8-phosphate phosphatase (KDO 8-P phosphatase)